MDKASRRLLRSSFVVVLSSIGAAQGGRALEQQNTLAPAPSALASTPASLRATSAVVPPLVLALGGSCTPSWLSTFSGMGTSDAVHAVAEYDAGAGPELYAAGSFLTAGGAPANRIAKWDGARWRALGTGLDEEVRALAVYDDGSGSALFVGGDFTTAGGAPAARIAKWDGTTWSSVGGGVNNTVRAFAVWDDGGGPALFVAGSFGQAGGASASRIARWDGTSWSTLGSGINGTVHALVVHDDGSGPALFVGGLFSRAGNLSDVNSIARWNGTSWAKLGNGLGHIRALAVHDAGAGPMLYAGGSFAVGTFFRIARWNGSSWSGLGNPNVGTIEALRAFDDGTGSKLWIGGNLQDFGGPGNSLLVYDGSTFQTVGSGVRNDDHDDLSPDVTDVLAFCTHDDGDGTALIVAGRFSDADDQDVNNVAKRVGSSFAGFGTGLDGSVSAAVTYDDGTGPALYVGGNFHSAEGVTLNHVGKWDGSQWTALGDGVDGNVHVLLVHDDGSGPSLFAGGDFVTADGATVSRIAKWNGTSWADLDRGVSLGGVRALAIHNGQLYVGGTFLVAGGAFGSTPVNRIARWDGARWHSMGTGVNTQNGVVNALISYDDGNGARLYAAGAFDSIGDTPIATIAKWTGSFWTQAGFFPDGWIEALAVYAGSLHAGGGMWDGKIARLNGTSWVALGDGTAQSVFAERVLSLAVHDDGSGAELYVGGNAGMLRWDGSGWSELDGGALGAVLAMTTCDVGNGPSLFAGGQVFSFVDSADSFLGEWGCDRVPPVITARPVHAVDQPGNGPGEVVPYDVEVSDDHDLAPDLWFSWPAGSVFPVGTTMVSVVATDAGGNSAIAEFPVTVIAKSRFKKL